jgi:hypothetical protein
VLLLQWRFVTLGTKDGSGSKLWDLISAYSIYVCIYIYTYICIYCIYAHAIFSKFYFFDERPFVSDPAKGSKQVNTSKGVVEDLI